MKHARIIYIFILLAALGFAIGLMDRLSTVVLIATLIIPIISLIFFLISFRSIKISLTPDDIYAQKLEQVSCTLEMRNRGIYPFIQVRLTGDFVDASTNRISKQRIVFELMPKQSYSMELPMCMKYRGEYLVEASYIDVYDVLGIFHFKLKAGARARIVVIPRLYAIGSLGTGTMSEDNESKSKNNAGIDKVDLSHIREYMDGDVLKTVHWKLSAKQDELMVKVLEDNSNSNVAIISDLNCYFNDYDKDNLAVDGVIESCLAVAYRKLADSCGSNIHFYSSEHKKIIRQEVKDENSFERLFSQLSTVKLTKELFPIEQLLDNLKREINEINGVFIITSSLTAERLTSFIKFSRTLSSEVNLLYVDLSDEFDPMLENMLKATGLRLWRLDPNDLKLSIEVALSSNARKY